MVTVKKLFRSFLKRTKSANFVIQSFIFLLFMWSMYTITSDYLKYDISTSVNRLTRYNQLPPIDLYFCIIYNHLFVPNVTAKQWKAASSDHFIHPTYYHRYTVDHPSDSIKDGRFVIERNGNELKITINSVYRNLHKCWLLEGNINNINKDIEEETYSCHMEGTSSRGYMKILKLIRRKRETRDDNPNVDMKLDSNQGHEMNMYILSLLPAPYTSNCHEYETTQIDCIESCMRISGFKRNENVTDEGRIKCSNECPKKDCKSILFFKSLTKRVQYSKTLVQWFSSLYVRFQSQPMFTFVYYTQQVIGLVTMFFELMILDIANPFVKLLLCVVRLLKRIGKLKMSSVKSYISKFITYVMWIGCLSHIIYSFISYMEYETTSETEYGKLREISVPSVAICYMVYDMEYFYMFPFPYMSYWDKNDGKQINLTFHPHHNFSKYSYRLHNKPCNVYNSPSLEPISNVEDVDHLIKIEMAPESNLLSTFYEADNFDKYYPDYFQHAVDPSTIDITSFYMERNNLPHPYETNCFNHPVMTVNSTPSSLIQIDNYWRHWGQFPRRRNLSYPTQMRGIKCKEKNLCLTHQNERRTFEGLRKTIVKILKPFLAMTNTMSPSQSLIEFATFTASTLSLWLGLSAASFAGIIKVIADNINKFKFLKYIHSFTYLLVYILPIVCFSVHMYSVIDGYMEYEIASTIKMDKSFVDSFLPCFTIILYFEPSTTGLRARTIKGMTSNLSSMSPNQFQNYYKNLSAIIPRVLMLDPLTAEPQFPRIENENVTYRRYVYEDNLLLTFNLNENFKHFWLSEGKLIFDWKKFDPVDPIFGFFIGPKIKYGDTNYYHHRLREYGHAMHPSIKSAVFHPSTYPYMPNIQKARYIPLRDSAIGYKYVDTTLLKDPYSSRCIDYNEYKETKFMTCLIQNHIMKYGKVPNDIPIPVEYNETRMKTDPVVRNKCNQLFQRQRPYCHDTYYEERPVESNVIRLLRIVWVVPPNERIINQFHAKSSLFDLFILICDVFGLWLGISLFVILDNLYSTVHFWSHFCCCCTCRGDKGDLLVDYSTAPRPIIR